MKSYFCGGVMKRIGSITFLILFVLMLQGSVFAQEQTGIKQGNSELAAMGSWQRISVSSSGGEEGSASMTLLALSYGYFFTDPLEIGASVAFMRMSAEGTDGTFTLFSPFVKYHFFLENPMTVPYVGAGFTYGKISGGDGDATIWGGGVNGGVNFFIKENFSIGPEARYDRWRLSSNSESATANIFTILAQVKIYF